MRKSKSSTNDLGFDSLVEPEETEETEVPEPAVDDAPPLRHCLRCGAILPVGQTFFPYCNDECEFEAARVLARKSTKGEEKIVNEDSQSGEDTA